LVSGFCSTVAEKLHGLSVQRAAASYRIGASLFARNVMRVFNDAFATMTSCNGLNCCAVAALHFQSSFVSLHRSSRAFNEAASDGHSARASPVCLPVQPVNVELEHPPAFLVEVRLNLQSFCLT